MKRMRDKEPTLNMSAPLAGNQLTIYIYCEMPCLGMNKNRTVADQ